MDDLSLAEIFRTPAEQLTPEAIAKMVDHFRAQRSAWALEEKTAQAEGRKPASRKAKVSVSQEELLNMKLDI